MKFNRTAVLVTQSKRRIYGTFEPFGVAPGCKCNRWELAAKDAVSSGVPIKQRSVTMILPIKNEGIFIVTLGFSEQLYGDFYAGLKDE